MPETTDVDPLDLGDWSTYSAEAQAAETGEPAPQQHFAWFGEQIRLRRHIAPLAFLDFYHGVETGKVTEAQIYGALRAIIDPADFTKFCDAADTNLPNDESAGAALLDVIDKALEARSARPTGQPSGSSDGSATTSPTSTADSEPKVADPPSTAARVAARLGIPLPPESRPDLRAALRLVDEPMPTAETG